MQNFVYIRGNWRIAIINVL